MLAETTQTSVSTVQQSDLHNVSSQEKVYSTAITPVESGGAKPRPPFWLSRIGLAIFFLVFLACAASLITLDRIIKSRNGLSLTISSSSYSWTYGPTAILVVILSFWRRIDYYHKAAQPWHELISGPVSADKSLLLDYVTPFQGISLIQALKHRHYAVAATITSFFLLKLIILVSTALFAVGQSLDVDLVAIRYQDTFDATDAWASFNYSYIPALPGAFLGGSEQPIWAYLARLNNATTNETAWRPSNGLVTQRFALSTRGTNVSSLEAPVDVFLPQIFCEEGEISAFPHGFNDTTLIFKMESASCSARNYTLGLCMYENEDGDDLIDSNCSASQRAFTMQGVNCSFQNDVGRNDDPAWPEDFEPYDIRYAITATKHGATISASDSATVESMELLESAALICKIGYGVVSANASLNLLTGEVSFLEEELTNPQRLISNLSAIVLGEFLMTSLHNAARPLLLDDGLPHPTGPQYFSSPRDTLFQLVFAALGSPSDLDIFYQPEALKNGTISVLAGIAMEFARETLLAADSTEGLAEGVFSQNRLFSRPVALWTMMAGFAALALFSLFLMFKARIRSWIPAMSGSIAGHAALLANSPGLHTSLIGTGHLQEEQLKQRVEGMQSILLSDAVNGTSIQAQGSGPATTEQTHQENEVQWLPLAARLPIISTTVILPMITIGVLELLHRLSVQRHGLINVNGDDSSVPSYIVRIASTLVIFAIATMINNLDFTIVMFAPYSSMRRKAGAQADRSILFHLLSVSPFLVLFKSLRRRQYGPAASNLAAIIAGFLTVIASGLWTLTVPIRTEMAETVLINNWDRSWLNDASDDGGAAARLNLIRRKGADTPAGIWEDYVIPKVTLPPSLADDSSSISHSADYTYNVMALKPILNCAVVPQDKIANEAYMPPKDPDGPAEWVRRQHTEVIVNPVVPLECATEVSSNGGGNLTYRVGVGSSFARVWTGHYFDLLGSTAGRVSSSCPSVGIIFGELKQAEREGRNLTALVCSQEIQVVPIRVTFRGDPASGQLNPDLPPVLSLDETRYLHNGTDGAFSLGYRLQEFMSEGLLPFAESDTDDTDGMDAFFNHLILGPEGYSREELVGLAHVEKFVEAVTRDYTEYMRHVIDLNFRASDESAISSLLSAEDGTTSPQAPYTDITGTTAREVTRLAVHGPSKLILQIVLGVMTFFGLLGYALTQIRGTLPRNPCSIASTMGFLAGSQMCDRDAGIIPKRAEFMSDDQLQEVLGEMMFILGWWRTRRNNIEDVSPRTPQDTSETEYMAEDQGTLADNDGTRFGIDIGESTGGRYGE